MQQDPVYRLLAGERLYPLRREYMTGEADHAEIINTVEDDLRAFPNKETPEIRARIYELADSISDVVHDPLEWSAIERLLTLRVAKELRDEHDPDKANRLARSKLKSIERLIHGKKNRAADPLPR